MNGKTAKKIRRYAGLRFSTLAEKEKASLRFDIRNLYKILKEQYYLKGRSFHKMVNFVK